MTPWRVTLDTNVLISGLRSRNGASFRILSRWLRGEFVACASVPLWLEYEATLKRDDVAAAHGLSGDEVDALLDAWSVHVVPVELRFSWRPQLRDPKDEMVLETALNGRAEALVTFNRDDFEHAARQFGVPLWRPQDLLARLKGE
ncbi:MAG: putative toxin-antitoxin system toxin component, PIN family [Burkholderiales bacterium]|nr:putative toxin-antitoxin system toxin component, PIN family [Burkholderiales bacterium]